MDVEIVIGIALLTLLAGASVGFFLGKGRGTSTRVKELEAALATSQTELADYRREVYGQFAQTAEKFRALDESYNDLHRQLAESSVALCGDDATPLLAGPGQSLLADTQDEKTVDAVAAEADIDTDAAVTTNVASNEPAADEEASGEETVDKVAADEAARVDAVSSEEELAQSGESEVRELDEGEAEKQTAANSADAAHSDATQVPPEDEDIIVAESSDVPVLTETEEADESVASRRSA